jgi:hypothetical protein
VPVFLAVKMRLANSMLKNFADATPEHNISLQNNVSQWLFWASAERGDVKIVR